jgi:MATE family multidrug resistance protein|uniref:MATE family efflux transporter n=1 Tax=Prevotella sp. TaxID=59823 RepID=UPI003FEF7E51
MNNHTTSITTNKKHHYQELLSIGFPIIIGQLGTIILGFADTLMIGHHSTPELAAAGLVNNIFGLVFVSYMGFTYGLTPIIGKLYGEERTDCIGQKVRNSFFANMLTGAIFTAVLILLYLNLAHIGQPEELLSLIRPYFLVNLASVLFMGIFFTMKQFLDGIGKTKVAMWAMIGGNVVNILGNWVLIYGVAGFPELGLLGAGISTLVSRILMALAMVSIVIAGKSFREYRHDLIHSSLNKADFKEMNRLGWPVALQLGMESAAFTLSCVMVGWLGTIPLAAHQVMITLSQLFYLVLSGMAAALAIRVSHFMGQKDYAAVRRNAYDGFRLNLLFSLCMGIPVFLLRHQIGGWFNDNAEVQAYVSVLIILMMIYQFGDGLQYTFANALRGIACVKPMVLYAFIAYFVISLPLGYTLGFTCGMGILGIWIAFPFGLTIAGEMYRRRFEKELKKIEQR